MTTTITRDVLKNRLVEVEQAQQRNKERVLFAREILAREESEARRLGGVRAEILSDLADPGERLDVLDEVKS